MRALVVLMHRIFSESSNGSFPAKCFKLTVQASLVGRHHTHTSQNLLRGNNGTAILKRDERNTGIKYTDQTNQQNK